MYTMHIVRQRNMKVIVILAILTSMLLFPTTTHASYSCIDPHCYGTTNWYGWMRGTGVVITIDNGSPGDGQYSQKTWVGSQMDNRNECSGYGDYCWVEGGYILRSGQASPGWYFYAWVDPYQDPQISLHEYDFDPVYTTDAGHFLGLTIDRDTSYNWYMQFATPHGTENITPFMSFVDTNNVFLTSSNPLISAGREIYGTDGISLPASSWSWNQYIDLNNTIHVQTNPYPTDGNWNPVQTGPVTAFFWPGQYPSQVNWGGTWYVNPGY